jgi:hypothetical protein
MNYYHVVSRVVNRELVFGDADKEYFRKLLVKQLKFSGLKAIAWCFMGNHFHLLLEVPDKEEALTGWNEDDYLKRLKVLMDEGHTWNVLRDVEMWKKNGHRDGVTAVAESVKARLFDLSIFMKELKQKFTIWFNRKNQRKGTLWEERFRSVLLEGPEVSRLENSAVKFVSAYIDLNPVRAGLVEDPKDYRWCSYAAAVAGNREARRGVAKAVGRGARAIWRSVSAEYRKFLFVAGGPQAAGSSDSMPRRARRGFSRQEIARVWKKGGNLTMGEVLYCQIRYVSDGVALGSREFLEDFFEGRKEIFGPARKTGARKMKGADWGGLMSIRDLSKDAIVPH